MKTFKSGVGQFHPAFNLKVCGQYILAVIIDRCFSYSFLLDFQLF